MYGTIPCCNLRCDLKGQLRADIVLVQPGDPCLHGYDSTATAERCAASFAKSVEAGLRQLVRGEVTSRLPAPLSFFREFMKNMVGHWLLCLRANPRTPLDPPRGWIESWTRMSRKIPKLSRLKAGFLRSVWASNQREVEGVLAYGVENFIAQNLDAHPLWSAVGKVIIHIHQSVGNPALPFVIKTGYVGGLSATTLNFRINPIIGPIFGDDRVPGLGDYLLRTLDIIAEKSSVLRRLFWSQEIFAPCGLIPRDTHQLLLEAPSIESPDVSFLVPQWWTLRRPPQLRTSTRVGISSPRMGTAPGMIDVATTYIVDEEELSEAEWRDLVKESVNGLVNLRGRWVELDTASISKAMEAWRDTEELRSRSQISYGEAIGLLNRDEEAERGTDGISEAEEIIAGPWLSRALAAVKSRAVQVQVDPGPTFHGILRPYQRAGVAWLGMMMELRLGALLADEMGLGKTIQVLALILSLRQGGVEGAVLLVVPASLIGNWSSEFDKFAPSVPYSIVHREYGDIPKSLDNELIITSYATLRRRSALREQAWSLVVIDEAQSIKNSETRTSRTIKNLSAQRRIALSGTPVENSIADLWSIMDFLNPGLLGSLPSFREKWAMRLGVPDGLEELRAAVRPYMLRRRKTDPGIADELPEKVEVTAYCGLTATQSSLYSQVLYGAGQRVHAAKPENRRGEVLNIIQQLKQICCHPTLYLSQGGFAHADSSKFIRTRQICQEIAASGEKVLVFTQFRSLIPSLFALLREAFGRPGLVFHGGTSVSRRPKVVAEFEDEAGPPFMVLSVKAGGTGLNLTAASHVIHFDLWWNPAAEAQATDRAHRVGQTKRVMVHRLVCRGTLEERIDLLLKQKRAIAHDLLAPEMAGDEFSSLSNEELIRLIDLNEGQASSPWQKSR